MLLFVKEEIERTRGLISGSVSNPQSKIVGVAYKFGKARAEFRVPTRNPEKYPGSNPERILFPLKTQPPAPPSPFLPVRILNIY